MMFKRLRRWWLLRELGYRPRRRELLRQEEIETALAVREEDPLYRSVRQLLAEQVDYASEQLGAPETVAQPQLMAHAAGGLEWLRQFDAYLERERLRAWEKVRAKEE